MSDCCYGRRRLENSLGVIEYIGMIFMHRYYWPNLPSSTRLLEQVKPVYNY